MVTRNEQGEFVWWAKGGLAVLAFLVPFILSGLYGVLSGYFDSLRASVEHIEQRVVFQEGIIRALSEAIARFDERASSDRTNIERLLTSATARPDPFTGTQGRALEGRIADLERCCRRMTTSHDHEK